MDGLGAALATVIGTSPLANLSTHHLQLVAAVIGLGGLLCLAATMLLVLRVMQPPEVSFEQIETAGQRADDTRSSDRSGHPASFRVYQHKARALGRWKCKVESHPDLYLPCGVISLSELRSSIKLEQATLVQLTRRGEDTADHATAKPRSTGQLR